MYSIVLVTALTAGTTAPGWHHGGYYGCGYGYAGSGCVGCWGCGGCYGCVGCSPTCGCYGAWTFGGYGFAGGGFGYHGGCYGAYGTWYGATVCSGCYGCHGGYSGYGMPVPMQPVPVVPVPMFKEPVPPEPPVKEKEIVVPKEKKEEIKKGDIKKEDIKKDDVKKAEKTAQVRARVRIDVPEGGKLFVDGQPIQAAAGVRLFHTPLLSAGQKYFYDIRIELERDGRVLSDQRRVILEAGQDVAVAFPKLVPKGTVIVQAEE